MLQLMMQIMMAFLPNLSHGDNKINCSLHGCNQLYLVICFVLSLNARIRGCFGTKFTPASNNTAAKLCQLGSELRHAKLKNCKNSISESVLRVRTLVGSINDIGESISPHKHLNVILEGSPHDFESTVSFIAGKFGALSLEEIETLHCRES